MTGPDLTPRQREIAVLVAEGYSSAQIAKALGLAVQTVKSHRSMVLAKLGARNSVEVANIIKERE